MFLRNHRNLVSGLQFSDEWFVRVFQPCTDNTHVWVFKLCFTKLDIRHVLHPIRDRMVVGRRPVRVSDTNITYCEYHYIVYIIIEPGPVPMHPPTICTTPIWEDVNQPYSSHIFAAYRLCDFAILCCCETYLFDVWFWSHIGTLLASAPVDLQHDGTGSTK